MSNPPKRLVALLFGGASVEHEVSLNSARTVLAALDQNKFEAVLIGISRSGAWRLCTPEELMEGGPKLLTGEVPIKQLMPPLTAHGRFELPGTRRIPDVVFPVLHGTGGEDGTIQGLLTLAKVPFVGPGVLGSALAMDKAIAKQLLQAAGLPVAKSLVLRAHNLSTFDIKTAIATLRLPLFVKPANCGSSVGVSKAHSANEVRAAIATAFRYDRKILLEEYIAGQEVECAVLGNQAPRAAEPGSLVPTEEFYSYDAKYTNAQGATFAIPAAISEKAREQITQLALEAFRTLECEGMARVDFFVTPDERIIINEVNTIPGFTSISMYPKLWEQSGLNRTELVTELIELALSRFQQQASLRLTQE